jgi:hypothetical protein
MLASGHGVPARLEIDRRSVSHVLRAAQQLLLQNYSRFSPGSTEKRRKISNIRVACYTRGSSSAIMLGFAAIPAVLKAG